MAQTKKAVKKRTSSKAAIKRPRAATRRLKRPEYRSLRLSKRIKHPSPNLPNVLKLLRASLQRLGTSKRLFIGIILVYGLLTIVLVKGFSGSLNVPQLKSSLQSLFQGKWSQLSVGLSLFGLLLGSVGSGTSPTAGLYQSILILIFSLVFIWSLRQVQAGHKIGLRDAFYKSLYPLIPFLLVLLVVGLQLLPLLIGGSVYNLVLTNGIAVSALERVIWALLFFGLALLSLYMLSSSLFALYIVTLPDMTPLRALRSARELVRYRRWTVLRKIIFLPIGLLLLGAIIVVPLILVLTVAAQWIFFVCTMIALAVVHSYMYNLYRELL